jgi:hypothetical protein
MTCLGLGILCAVVGSIAVNVYRAKANKAEAALDEGQI